MSDESATARRRRKEARPQELLDAALALFVEKGFAATRAEEVAVRAGVSKGTLYLYYPSKEELLKAVIAQHLSTQVAAGAEAVERFDGSCAALLSDLLARWWQHVLESPASRIFQLMITGVRDFPEIATYYRREVIEPATQLVGQVVQRGIDRGEFRPVDVPAAIHSLVLPLVMLCVHRHSMGACLPPDTVLDGPAFIRQHIALVLGGLLRRDDPLPA